MLPAMMQTSTARIRVLAPGREVLAELHASIFTASRVFLLFESFGDHHPHSHSMLQANQLLVIWGTELLGFGSPTGTIGGLFEFVM
jgi:hypothetical protein